MKKNNKYTTFHQSVTRLLNTSIFLKSIEVKCRHCSDVLKRDEAINIAYEIAIKQIGEGKDIPNPEAWMRLTIWNLLRSESRKQASEKKRFLSFENRSSDSNGNRYLSLEETIAAKDDPNHPYIRSQIEEEAKDNRAKLKRLELALEKLKPEERKILELRIVRELSWKKVAQQLNFEGKISSLRQKGKRALDKLKKAYAASGKITR